MALEIINLCKTLIDSWGKRIEAVTDLCLLNLNVQTDECGLILQNPVEHPVINVAFYWVIKITAFEIMVDEVNAESILVFLFSILTSAQYFCYTSNEAQEIFDSEELVQGIT